MSKTLQVIQPFLFMNFGDTFELSKDGKSYIAETKEEVNGSNSSDTVESSYYGRFTISIDYAKSLIREGYLSEVEYPTAEKFVNIFDEIDVLLNQYNTELKNINIEFEGQPQCLKVEKITVLKNLIKVLEHLKSLKK